MISRAGNRCQTGGWCDCTYPREQLWMRQGDEQRLTPAHGKAGNSGLLAPRRGGKILLDKGHQICRQVVDEIVIAKRIAQVHACAGTKLLVTEDVGENDDHFFCLAGCPEIAQHDIQSDCIARHPVLRVPVAVENVQDGISTLLIVIRRQQHVDRGIPMRCA